MSPDSTVKSLKIALFSYDSLGDGLVFLLIANNMHQAGYSITYFSRYMAEFSQWFPHLNVLPYPNNEQWQTQFDIVLMDAKAPPMQQIPESEYCAWAKKFIFIAATRLDRRLIYNHRDKFSEFSWSQTLGSSHPFKQLSGPIFSVIAPSQVHMDKPFRTLLSKVYAEKHYYSPYSMVDSALDFCNERLLLSRVEKFPPLKIPTQLIFKRYPNRVIICPTSPNPHKNWGANQFIHLAERLKKLGYQVHFVVSPQEHQEWQEKLQQRFPLPIFPRIDLFAAFIYESGALIANDSGGGHLASFLKIPTITLVKKNKYFPWRPGWGRGIVVYPTISFKVFGKRIWRPFIRISHIINALSLLQVPNHFD